MKIKLSFIAFVLITLLFSFNTVVWAESKITDVKAVENAESKITDVKAVEKVESKITDVKAVENAESKITDVKAVENAESKITDVKAVENAEGKITDVKAVEKVESKITDVKAVENAESKITDVKAVENAESKITDVKAVEKAESKITDVKAVENAESKITDVKAVENAETLPIIDNKVKIINKVFTLPTVEKMEINQALTADNLGLENKAASFFYLNKLFEGTFNPQDYLNIEKVVPEGMVDDFIIVTFHLADKDYTPKYFKAFVENLEQEAKKEKQIIAEKTENYIITYSPDIELKDYSLLSNSVSLINGSLVEVNKMHIMEYNINNMAVENQEAEIKKALETHANFLKQLEDLNKN